MLLLLAQYGGKINIKIFKYMEISITSAPDYNSLKQTFNEYALIDPGIKLQNVIIKNKK